jgi:hypothetical protein
MAGGNLPHKSSVPTLVLLRAACGSEQRWSPETPRQAKPVFEPENTAWEHYLDTKA